MPPPHKGRTALSSGRPLNFIFPFYAFFCFHPSFLRFSSFLHPSNGSMMRRRKRRKRSQELSNQPMVDCHHYQTPSSSTANANNTTSNNDQQLTIRSSLVITVPYHHIHHFTSPTHHIPRTQNQPTNSSSPDSHQPTNQPENASNTTNTARSRYNLPITPTPQIHTSFAIIDHHPHRLSQQKNTIQPPDRNTPKRNEGHDNYSPRGPKHTTRIEPDPIQSNKLQYTVICSRW
ncbi:hypothetical protein EX30DRAFT_36608 [Ascodesmis nigricans]|uniref:Uncharacterized protein n=1 Tax=Ascodesmis nigricans TaxID=341454 RepID=A0A4S2MWM9_9PEZI|nr:hypothetical protein EX30DRAFT_36608 [Ascodesmis nigricans]